MEAISFHGFFFAFFRPVDSLDLLVPAGSKSAVDL